MSEYLSNHAVSIMEIQTSRYTSLKSPRHVRMPRAWIIARSSLQYYWYGLTPAEQQRNAFQLEAPMPESLLNFFDLFYLNLRRLTGMFLSDPFNIEPIAAPWSLLLWCTLPKLRSFNCHHFVQHPIMDS